MESLSALTHSIGSIPCQNRCDGSKLTPILSPASRRRRSAVSVLYTRKPGCDSMATRTPCLRQNADCSFQYGIAISFHCHSSTVRKSGGQGQVTQDGYFE